MKFPVPENLTALARSCPFPLYVVGGSVRDFLAGFPLPPSPDWDICGAGEEDELLAAAQKCGFEIKSVYRNTGTVKLKDKDGNGCEFTRFRSDKYVRGVHTPAEITFTDDMGTDARRRDFCANAIYYDIGAAKFCDPLGGIPDIKNKLLRTVAPATKVFGEDGLRLMRLARIAAETGFSPDRECTAGASEHRALIRDIAPERIFAELRLLLLSDLKHGDREAPYRGLTILQATGVLGEILPELALGHGMTQRADFHDHDVLEHSFRCVRYSPPEIRFAALLHDVGKPFCKLRDGNFHLHAEEGATLAKQILLRLKAPKKLAEETAELVRLHMRDYDLQMKESKVRRELVHDFALLDMLFALKQADFSACKDDLSPAPSVVKWKSVLAAMRREGAPCNPKELAVNGSELIAEGVPPQKAGACLSELLDYAAADGKRNEKAHLLARAKKYYGETP